MAVSVKQKSCQQGRNVRSEIGPELTMSRSQLVSSSMRVVVDQTEQRVSPIRIVRYWPHDALRHPREQVAELQVEREVDGGFDLLRHSVKRSEALKMDDEDGREAGNGEPLVGGLR